MVLVVGSSVFPYYPYIPGALLAEGTQLVEITSDPAEAARAPMGDAILGDVALALKKLVELVGESDRPAPDPRPAPGDPPEADPISGSQAMAALADAWPQDGIAVVETPSSTIALRNRLRLSAPGSYYFSASGGLGFGISAAVGVQLAQPGRPVVCVLGEGSAQYGITALWTAVAYKVPVTFLVLRNEEYMILKWFATMEQVSGAPGLELPGLDVAAVARGYGMNAREVSGRDELTEALREEIPADDGPRLDTGAGRLRDVDGVVDDRAPDWVAGGTPEPLRTDLIAALGEERVRTRALDLVALRVRREPVPANPQGRGDAARHRRRDQAAQVRPRARRRRSSSGPGARR